MPTIETLAYCKMALHAVKFPHCSVHGLLVGRAAGQADEAGGVEWTVVDALPVFHHFVTAPPLEAALIVAEQWCEAQKLRIVGSYFANARNNDDTIDVAWAKPLHEKLVANGVASPLLFRLDNQKLSLNSTDSCVAAYTYEAAKWKQLSSKLADANAVLSSYSAALQSKLHRELHDFETHLEDPAENDFLNEKFAKKVGALLA
ncbi:MPN domain-containing protein [Aphelenchoides fujianensis]|nr:MPN domain-containing protein [Aphelenchoides fujianensis]